MFTCAISFLSLLFIMYDTTGYIVCYSNKEATEESKSDYTRLVRTWIFYMAIGWLACTSGCCKGEGFIALILSVVFAVSRLLVALPVTGFARLLQNKVIDDGLMCKLAGNISCMVKSKMSPVQEEPVKTSSE